MKKITTAFAIVAASPAFAASGPFFSLYNTDFVVTIAFLVFVAILLYFGVPGQLGGMLDKRAQDIRSDLEEAKSLREEAQSLLADYQRKQREVQEQADRIVETARDDARLAADQAKEDLKASIERRLAAAEDQIASAESSAIKEVRDQAVAVAVAAARKVVAQKLQQTDKAKLIDASIDTVASKLH